MMRIAIPYPELPQAPAAGARRSWLELTFDMSPYAMHAILTFRMRMLTGPFRTRCPRPVLMLGLVVGLGLERFSVGFQ